MQFRSLKTSSTGYIRPGQLNKGDTITGRLLGKTPNRHNATRLDVQLELIENFGKFNVGDVVTVNGTGQLTYHVAKMSEGTVLRLEYNGKEKLKSGKDAHQFDIAVGIEDDGRSEKKTKVEVKKPKSILDD